MSTVRLQKYLAECGIASRRASEKLIEAGRVRVNGDVAALGAKVDPASDDILLDGAAVAPSDKKVYVVLNKPAGTVSTAKDTHDRPTVLDCIHGVTERVFPVGRLDMDVEGVLLLTNDGELANRLIHPRYEIDKIYVAKVKGLVQPEAARRLEKGVHLEDGMTAPARAVIMNANPQNSTIQLTIHEGRKREVKRMCAAVGHPVIRLHRVAFGNIRARGLRPGEWRYLNPGEIAKLRHIAKLDNNPKVTHPSV